MKLKNSVFLVVGLGLFLILLGKSYSFAYLYPERERLINIESPFSVGKYKLRADLQHNFKDNNPMMSFKFTFGLSNRIQISIERFGQVEEVKTFGKEARSSYNEYEGNILWQIFNEDEGQKISLSIESGSARYRWETKFDNLTAEGDGGFENLKLIIHKKIFPFLGTYLVPKIGRDKEKNDTISVIGMGIRLRIIDAKRTVVDFISDVSPFIFNPNKEKTAWGFGFQCQPDAPHIFSLFLSNTSGAVSSVSLKSSKDTFWGFRWSHRF